jgi:hypothetical protein
MTKWERGSLRSHFCVNMASETNSNRRLITWLAGISLSFCAICFYAGRLSVSTSPQLPPTPPAVTPAAPAPVAELRPIPAPPAEPARRASSPTASPTNRWDEAQWQLLLSQPGTPARNAAMARLLEALAATDPQQALALAQAEANLNLREDFLHAALRGWGSAATEAAADWVLAHLDENSARDAAIAAVFTGAAAKPEEALRAGKKICTDHPAEAAGFGNSLIDALCNAGNFSFAVQFVTDATDPQQRSVWTAEAYSRWAVLQPEQAAQAAAALTDPAARNEALHGIIGGWAQADPAALTQFLAGLPSGGDRGSMIGQALQSWARLDPEAVADWINNRDASPDYDEGVAAVAGASFVKTDIALGWVESIHDPRLRSEALGDVLHNWILEDLPAAKRYFEMTSDLLPDDRKKVAEIIAAAESGE